MLIAVAAVAVLAVPAASGSAPHARAAATCADFPNQAAAQRAHNTRDADGDGIYCEALPCPCLKPGQGSQPAPRPACERSRHIVGIAFSRRRYPNIYAHYLAAVAKGWPRILVIDRPGADGRRIRLLEGWPTKPGFDRDEYPPAIARGRGPHLMQGANPTGWKADVAYVPSGENRAQGAEMGLDLRRWCNGQRFRYVWR